MDISLTTNYGLLYFIISLILSFGIAWYYYRRSVLEGIRKKLFAVLRFLSLFFIFLLFSSPVISLIKKTFTEPVNVWLIDNSQSLLIDNRENGLKELLNGKLKNSLSGNSKDLYFLFSGNLLKEIKKDELGEITYNGINNFETDLTSSLYSLQERLANEDLSAVTVISDGIINEGGNPETAAKLLNAPVNYILTGDTIQKNDLVLKNIFYNKTAFIESNVPVNFEVNSFRYNADVKVNLYEEDNLIQSKVVKVTEDKISYDLTFNVMSNAERILKYKIELEGLDGEITLKNNYREFFIKYVNNRFRVLVLSGGPGADFAFISGEIRKVKNFESTFLTQKSATEFYEGAVPDLKNFDSYIFIGFPTAVTNQNILNEIGAALDKNNSSLFFFNERNADLNKLSVLYDKLPFKTVSYSDREEQTGIRTVSKLDDDIFKNSGLVKGVNSFPDIFKTASSFSVNPSAETFLIMNRNSEPAFVIQNTDKNRSAAFLAYGSYKWRLNNRKTNAEEVLSYMLTSTIIAITDKEQKRTFTIETTRPVYSKFENVKFSARITNYELQGGEKIRVKINGSRFSASFDLLKKDNRFFEGGINVPEDGTYDYTAELMSGANLIESINDRFIIGENNYEYKLTRADDTFLRKISSDTRGVNFTNAENSAIRDSLFRFGEQSRSEFRSRKNFELNVNPYFMGIIIFLLCLEWFLRKWNNLP